MTTAIERYRAATDRRTAIEAEIKAEVQEAFGEMAREIFARHPKVTGFAWTQYTPYFNDGDPCVFAANIDYITIRATVSPEESGHTDAEEHDDGEWDYSYCEWSEPSLYEYMKSWPQKEQDDWLAGERAKSNEERTSNPVLYPACIDIKNFLAEFEGDLEGLFGDHVKVWVTPTGVEPQQYDHD